MEKTKFIHFGGEITNINYVICFYKASGKNAYFGQYSIIMVRQGCDNVYQWFDTEDERDKAFDEISKKMCD